MNDRVAQLPTQMTTLEEEFRATVQQKESKSFFNIKVKRVEF